MIENIPLNNILFLDIETVSQYPDYETLPQHWKKLWNKKSEQIDPEKNPAETYPKAGIYAEFGKIIVIAFGHIRPQSNQLQIKTLYNHNEKKLLQTFLKIFNKYFDGEQWYLCAHNGKEFDFPYIARRLLINGFKLPSNFATYGKKPWEVKHLDTMQLWRFGDYKAYTSLDLLSTAFGIPSPKNDISGEDVYKIYWQEKNLPRIAQYCANDVIAVAQLFLKYTGREPIDPKNIKIL